MIVQHKIQKSKLRFFYYDLNRKDFCFVSTLLHGEWNANRIFRMACFFRVLVVPHFRGSVPKLVDLINSPFSLFVEVLESRF